MTKQHRRGPWSQNEDQYLLSLVQSQGAHNWVRIAQLIQSRSPKQCRERYHQNLKPSLNLTPISPEEGAAIERLVAEMGKRWAEIARRLNNRSDNAVKNWWNGGMNRRKRLDNRRADAAARAAPTPRPVTYEQMPLSGAHTFQSQFPMDMHQPQQQRLQPLPPPIMTGNSKLQHPQRRFIETPVPSPSTISNLSRNDSIDGPPSLISDMSAYSANSQSPHTPYGLTGAVELPPLPAGSGERNNSIASASGHMYQHYGNPWGFHQQEQADPKTMQQSFQMPYYGATSHDGKPMPVLPSQSRPYDQLQLPSFSSVTAPQARLGGPPSPPRDSRMSLRNVVD